jgi:homoserine O-acetyltransferase
MSPTTLAAAGSDHVEAYCCTGTSPGRAGRATVRVPLAGGRTLETRVGYELHGPPGAPAVVVLGGISADHHLAPTPADDSEGWWPGLVGPARALDTDRFRLLGIDWAAAPGEHLDGPVPVLTTHDQARALAAVMDHLSIDVVGIVGASYGGMVGLAFAELFPSRVRRLGVLCAAHRTHPMATALRALQRRFVAFAAEAGSPDVGLSLGRALAMTTYRSAEEFDARFDWRADTLASPARFPVESYLDARGDAFAARFSPERFAALSESIDLHSVEPTSLTAPSIVVSVASDALVPPWLVDELADRAPGVEAHLRLDSVYGHDAFLKETGLVSDAIREVLGREVEA